MFKKPKREKPSPAEAEDLHHLQKRIEIDAKLKLSRECLESLPSKGQSIVTEITLSHSMLNVYRFSAIKNTLPGAKVVFLMRDAMSRYWSHLRFHQTMNPSCELLEDIDSLLENQVFFRKHHKKAIQ